MIEPTDKMVQLIYERIDFVNHGDDGIREGLADVFALMSADALTEHGAAFKSGDVQVWANDADYPDDRRIPSHQRMGGVVLSRKVIVVDDWHKVTPDVE